MSWISPTGHNDPDSIWTNEANAYDGDTGTRAYSPSQSYLELNHAAILCNKVRIWCARYPNGLETDADIDVDVYYGGAWHNIHSGTVTKQTWVELSIGSIESVTVARIKSNDFFLPAHQFRIYEFAFWRALTNLVDTNVLIRTYLLTSSILTDPLIALIGDRLYCPRLPENATLSLCRHHRHWLR